MGYGSSYFLICLLCFLSSLARIEMAPFNQTSTWLYTSQMPTIDYFTLTDGGCDSCCETRSHGHLVVKAEVIEQDRKSTSFQPFSSTPMPYSTTDHLSTQTNIPTNSTSTEGPSITTTLPTVSSQGPITRKNHSSTAAPSTSGTTLSASTSPPFTLEPSSLFPSTFVPSSSLPDFSCGVGEICCETRSIGHLVVVATVIE